MGSSNDGKKSAGGEVDIYRDTPVRLLGYANEVGESFRSIISKHWVHLSYGVAFTYVLADTRGKVNKIDPALKREKIVQGFDVLLWQTLASVAIPGFTINRICKLTGILVKTLNNPSIRKWTPTFVGLGSIPFIVKPIDHLVDVLMDNTYRKVCKPNINNTSTSTGNKPAALGD